MTFPAGPRPDTIGAAVVLPDSIVARQPRTVAVLRALQLGDLLCAVPALRALRAALPHAEIALIGLPWAADFARRFAGYVDAFIDFPGYPGLVEREPDFDRVPGFLTDTRRRRFDVLVQMHGSGEITNPLSMLLGARSIAGFYRRGQYCPDPSSFLPYPEEEPELRRPLTLLRWLGVQPRGEYLEFPLDDLDREQARLAVRGALRRRYVCVHPGARSADRRWSPEAFARVADAVAARGAQIVLTGGPGEAPLTRAVAAAMREPALDLAGRTSLGALAALIAGARLLVCNDTGVSHVADALRTPSVVIFTGSDSARWAPLDRKTHRAVLSPSPGGRRTPADDRAMVDCAIAEADRLVGAEDSYAA